MTVEDDGAYFATVLDELGNYVQRHLGEDATAFLDLVRRRIEHGAALYGPRAFLDEGRDNLLEARDEYADGVAYPLFELRALGLDQAETPGGVHQLLFDAMFLAAAASLKVRQARRLRDQP